MTGIIDVHSHIVLGIGDEPIPRLSELPKLTPDDMLRLMDAHGIEAVLLSIPDSANRATGEKAREFARRTNEALAEIVAKHPRRFGAMATLPGKCVDDAVAEVRYAVDVLKLDGVATSTSIGDVYLGDPQFDPLLEAVRDAAVPLFVHPTATTHSKPVDLGLPRAILEFMFDTTRMMTNMVLSGAKRRYSDLTIIATHGGGAIPYLAPRIQGLASRRKPQPGQLQLSQEEIREGFASFYFDLTTATSKAQLAALLELVPTDRVLTGFDMPFADPATIPLAIDDVKTFDRFDGNDRAAIFRNTALSLFPTLAKRLAT